VTLAELQGSHITMLDVRGQEKGADRHPAFPYTIGLVSAA